MRWQQGRRSSNVDDRRGRRVSRPVAIGGGGIGLLLIVVAALFLGVDPTPLLQDAASVSTTSPSVAAPASPEQDRLADFVSVVLADTEDVWGEIFAAGGQQYREPTLVLFSDAIQSACGFAGATVGPFYCPADQQIYIDLAFYDELRTRFEAPGDFAQAYVIAHEVGHHIQHLLGISDQVQLGQAGLPEAERNNLSVRLELQADCFAGVWAHHAQRARQVLEAGDLEEALGAASAIGDDRIQRRSGGAVVPDSFTHGTSEQRVRWFRIGFETGDGGACDTFVADPL
ncbi:MAG TPA: neutral zinc metallopeptidase [Candidatus Sulfomarinibacteraceae bacterium]|nr:neutral zinc metallopeptidase [Candidatus Sulfomarinibacteraceae bacterium]